MLLRLSVFAAYHDRLRDVCVPGALRRGIGLHEHSGVTCTGSGVRWRAHGRERRRHVIVFRTERLDLDARVGAAGVPVFKPSIGDQEGVWAGRSTQRPLCRSQMEWVCPATRQRRKFAYVVANRCPSSAPKVWHVRNQNNDFPSGKKRSRIECNRRFSGWRSRQQVTSRRSLLMRAQPDRPCPQNWISQIGAAAPIVAAH